MSNKKLNIAESITPHIELSVNISKSNRELVKDTIKKLIEEETKIVRGIFQCFESPGSTTKIIVRKYPGIPTFEKSMTDGETYDVPLYVARHLNGIDVSAGVLSGSINKNFNIGTCSYGIHGFRYQGNELAPSAIGSGPRGEPGIPVPIVGISKRVRRYGFQSLEFATGAS